MAGTTTNDQLSSPPPNYSQLVSVAPGPLLHLQSPDMVNKFIFGPFQRLRLEENYSAKTRLTTVSLFHQSAFIITVD